jgi:hypothetical protein
MGKPLLILALTFLWVACEGGGPPAGDGREDGGPAENAHAGQPCAACHSGPQGERGRATVPELSCRDGGCHEDGGPEEVFVATVRFPHRGHGLGGGIEPSCAGCHTHDRGDEPLSASVAACALCHMTEVTSADAQECRLCHVRPNHSELTNQGVAVSHSELPWVEIGCVRCHYDVSAAEPDVAGLKCMDCHNDMAELNRRAVGRDLHPIHEGVTCTSCHRDDVHEVRAMSSVVDLVCSDCHGRGHGISLGTETAPLRGLCASCHTGVHAAQQRLILGIRPDGSVMPSEKFLAGITCRSCHVPTNEAVDRAIRGQASACAGCHPAQYTRVLNWWLTGVQTRLRAVDAYVEEAGQRIPAGRDSAQRLLDAGRAMVSLVAEAGGQHNLELSDRLLREAVERAREAYDVAGVAPSSPPELGRVPHMGLCSYCHYDTTELWNIRDMPEGFHRDVLGQ